MHKVFVWNKIKGKQNGARQAISMEKKDALICHTRGLSGYKVFLDFDNTLTSFDVLDDIIERFSSNKDWMRFENLWKSGKIGSQECLENQLKSVKISKARLKKYLSGIRIAPSARKFLKLLAENRVKLVILSDSFSFIIRSILNGNGVNGIKIYSNRLRFVRDRLIPSFPHTDGRCLRCGHCKNKHLIIPSLKDKIIVYIGDGLSDICPARNADVVFAKADLLGYFRKNKIPCIAFNDFRQVYGYFRRLINATERKNKKAAG